MYFPILANLGPDRKNEKVHRFVFLRELAAELSPYFSFRDPTFFHAILPRLRLMKSKDSFQIEEQEATKILKMAKKTAAKKKKKSG